MAERRVARRSGERAAPLVLVVEPAGGDELAGSYASVAAAGKRLLAAELSQRLGAAGAGVARLVPEAAEPDRPFGWGRWFVAGVRRALREAGEGGRRIDAVGYAGAGALALLEPGALEELLSPVAGEVVANNRYSADAFVVAGEVEPALAALEGCAVDNAAVRTLEEAGWTSRDLSAVPWSRFDVDTPLDLALLRLAARLPTTRRLLGIVTAFLEMARLPGGGALEVPRFEALGDVIRDREAELVVAGRIPSSAWAYLEAQTACRVRCFVEERGMRSARDAVPRSLLADWAGRLGAADLVRELVSLGDAVILDSRVVMAALAGTSDAAGWPPQEERFASDFLDAGRVATPWLAELTTAAAEASVPVLLGGHALVSDGLRILVEAAWLGR